MCTLDLAWEDNKCDKDVRRGTLVFRSPRSFCTFPSSRKNFKVLLAEDIEYIHVLLWAPDDAKSYCQAMQGHAYVDVMNRKRRSIVLELENPVDNTAPVNIPIARMTISFSSSKAPLPLSRTRDLSHVLDEYCDRVYHEIRDRYPSSRQSEHKYAGDWLFNDTFMHSPPLVQRIPMCYFAMDACETFVSEAEEVSLAHMYEWAKIRMQPCPFPKDSFYWTLECLNELLTFLPLCCVYRLDHSGDQFIDQWMDPFNAPQLGFTGFDCEDCAVLAVRVFYKIRRCIRNPDMRRVTDLALDLDAFVCTVSLITGEEHGYHAVCGLTSSVWAEKLVRSLLASKNGTVTCPHTKLYFLECTAYTYLHQHAPDVDDSKLVEEWEAQPLGNLENLVMKCPRSLTSTRHDRLFVIHTPQFAHLGCTQITFEQENGEIGVKITQPMNWKGVRAWMGSRIHKEVHDLAMRTVDENRALFPLPEVAKPTFSLPNADYVYWSPTKEMESKDRAAVEAIGATIQTLTVSEKDKLYTTLVSCSLFK